MPLKLKWLLLFSALQVPHLAEFTSVLSTKFQSESKHSRWEFSILPPYNILTWPRVMLYFFASISFSAWFGYGPWSLNHACNPWLIYLGIPLFLRTPDGQILWGGTFLRRIEHSDDAEYRLWSKCFIGVKEIFFSFLRLYVYSPLLFHKAMPIKCFVSHRPCRLLWWWVGRSSKKNKKNENFVFQFTFAYYIKSHV